MRIWIALFLALALTGEGRALAAGLDDGIAAYRSGDYAKARELLGPLAEKGDYNAQFHMGEMTLKGLGGEASVDDAFGWYLKAATAGHAQAQANVGSMIALGLSETSDPSLGMIFVTEVNGSPFNQPLLGVLNVPGTLCIGPFNVPLQAPPGTELGLTGFVLDQFGGIAATNQAKLSSQ